MFTPVTLSFSLSRGQLLLDCGFPLFFTSYTLWPYYADSTPCKQQFMKICRLLYILWKLYPREHTRIEFTLRYLSAPWPPLFCPISCRLPDAFNSTRSRFTSFIYLCRGRPGGQFPTGTASNICFIFLLHTALTM